MNFSKTLFVILLLVAPFSAYAQWSGGVAYSSGAQDGDGVDVDLGMVSASLAYSFGESNGFSNIVEVRLGTGASDDTLLGVDVELDSFVQIAYRPQFEIDNNFYVYGLLSYASVEFELSALGASTTVDGDEAGIGAGIGYRLTDSVDAEVSYESIDDFDVFTLGLKFGF